MRFLDTNCWMGAWPFASLPARSAAALQAHLAEHGVARALVSSFDALFQSDPTPANRALMLACREHPGLLPLPVINPAMPAWQEHLARCVDTMPVRAIRLLPGYHRYRLTGAAVGRLVEDATGQRIRIVVTARLVDERHEHPAVRVKPVKVPELAAFLERHADVESLVQGLTRHEVDALAGKTKRFLTDLSFAEWEDTLRVLRRKLPVARMVFGSLTPLHVLRAQVDKVRLSTLSEVDRRAVAADNAQRFLNL
jgi:uncharacterized protein